MAKYIDREAFISDIAKWYCDPCEAIGKDYNHCACRACWVNDMILEIEDLPAADVDSVKHGRWNRTTSDYECSICQYPMCYITPYCPYCGAKMDLEG